MKRNNQSEIQAKKFKSYYRIWLQTSGPMDAGYWMAAHIGHLDALVGQLQKQVRKLEKKVFKKPTA